MHKRHAVQKRSRGVKLVIWYAIVAFFFIACSPLRLGILCRQTIQEGLSHIVDASLFFELNPFLPNSPQTENPESSESQTKQEVTVIDTEPSMMTTANSQTDSIYLAPETTVQQEEPPAISSSTPTESIAFRNETSINPDTQQLLEMENAFSLVGDGPQVLIIHTHTCEAYTPDELYPYTPDDVDRTLDETFNVVRVGDTLSKLLTDAGIGVIHDKTVHDYPSYSGSYNRTLETIAKNLKEEPNIKIVLDIHRDAMIDADGTKYKTYAQIDKNGEVLDSAQIMLVVGTNEGGMTHPEWEKNLSFAVKLQNVLNELYPGLMRPINLRQERFNQHATTGSLILEIGSSGNTLGEALTAIDLFADGLIALLSQYQES